MSAKKTEVAEESKGVVVQEAAGGLVAVDMGFLEMGDFGAGFEGADKDSYAIPFLQILQKMSPKVDKDDPAYIPGAEAGMLYNTVTGRLYEGKKGLDLVPCAYKRSYILWGGREGGESGFKGEFTVEEFEALKLDPAKVKMVEGKPYVPNEDGSVNEKKNAFYADTRSHYVTLIDPETGEFGNAIVSLASSQIKSSKKLLTSLQQKKVQTPKGLMTPPTFANLVRMTTVGMKNDQGSWSGAEFTLKGLVADRNIFDAAKEFHAAIIAGTMKADYSKADATEAAGEAGVGGATEAEGF